MHNGALTYPRLTAALSNIVISKVVSEDFSDKWHFNLTCITCKLEFAGQNQLSFVLALFALPEINQLQLKKSIRCSLLGLVLRKPDGKGMPFHVNTANHNVILKVWQWPTVWSHHSEEGLSPCHCSQHSVLHLLTYAFFLSEQWTSWGRFSELTHMQ